MLYLNPSNPNIFVAKQTHNRYITCFVNKKIGGPKCTPACAICTSSRKQVSKLSPIIRNFLKKNTNLDTVITGDPSQLIITNTALWALLFPGDTMVQLQPYFRKKNKRSLDLQPLPWKTKYRKIQRYIRQLGAIFDYGWFSSNKTKPYNAFSLSKALDRYTCTYCNRLYTSTIILKNLKPITRPTLDHWFPKNEFPLFAISFFNLIPSCQSCNSSVKGMLTLSLNDHIHPYLDPTQSTDFYFDYAFTALDGYRISIRDTANGALMGSKASKTLQEMFLDEIYNSNISELRDILRIKRNYSSSYIKIMQSLLKVKMSTREVYRILFGVIYEHQDYHKRPLSKFKFDILKKLEMLDEMD